MSYKFLFNLSANCSKVKPSQIISGAFVVVVVVVVVIFSSAKTTSSFTSLFFNVADMAKKANVGQLWLTHFSPSLIRAEDYMPAVRKIFPESYLGKDGKCIELVFQEE